MFPSCTDFLNFPKFFLWRSWLAAHALYRECIVHTFKQNQEHQKPASKQRLCCWVVDCSGLDLKGVTASGGHVGPLYCGSCHFVGSVKWCIRSENAHCSKLNGSSRFLSFTSLMKHCWLWNATSDCPQWRVFTVGCHLMFCLLSKTGVKIVGLEGNAEKENFRLLT